MPITLPDTKKGRLFTHSEGISNLLEDRDIKMLSDISEPLQALHKWEHLGALFLCFLASTHMHGLSSTVPPSAGRSWPRAEGYLWGP